MEATLDNPFIDLQVRDAAKKREQELLLQLENLQRELEQTQHVVRVFDARLVKDACTACGGRRYLLAQMNPNGPWYSTTCGRCEGSGKEPKQATGEKGASDAC